MTFEEAAREHANSRGAIGTRALYLHDLDRWLTFCSAHVADPARPTLSTASAFKDELATTQKGLTIRRTLAALSAMYEAARNYEQPLASWNPFKKLPRPPADVYSRTEVLTAQEVEAIFASAAKENTARDITILRLLYDTGLRRATVASLEREFIVRRGNETILKVIVKGGKRREVQLTEKAAAALDSWLRSSNSKWVFPAGRREGSLHPSTLNKIISMHGKRAGVVHAHPHRFRASYATTAIDAGVALHEVQASMMHSSPVTTQRYDRGQRGLGVADEVAFFRENGRKKPPRGT
jgi:integrase